MPFPTGLSDAHQRPAVWHRHASPLALLILGGMFVAALFGVFGGGAPERWEAETEAATLLVRAPDTLRNGEFFETRVTMTPKRDATDLTLAVSPSLWLRVTQNTMIPAAEEETFKDGTFRFSYGEAKAGEPVHIKIDLQLNPDLRGRNAGEIAVFDGNTKLASVPVSLFVYP